MKALTKYKYIGFGKTEKPVREMKERMKIINKLKVNYLLAITIAIFVTIWIARVGIEMFDIAIEILK